MKFELIVYLPGGAQWSLVTGFFMTVMEILQVAHEFMKLIEKRSEVSEKAPSLNLPIQFFVERDESIRQQ